MPVNQRRKFSRSLKERNSERSGMPSLSVSASGAGSTVSTRSAGCAALVAAVGACACVAPPQAACSRQQPSRTMMSNVDERNEPDDLTGLLVVLATSLERSLQVWAELVPRAS